MIQFENQRAFRTASFHEDYTQVEKKPEKVRKNKPDPFHAQYHNYGGASEANFLWVDIVNKL